MFKNFQIEEVNGRYRVRCSAQVGAVLKTVFKTAKWSPRTGWDLSATTLTINKLKRVEAAWDEQCAAAEAEERAAENEAIDEERLAREVERQASAARARSESAKMRREAAAKRLAAAQAALVAAQAAVNDDDIEKMEKAESAAAEAERKVSEVLRAVVDVCEVREKCDRAYSLYNARRTTKARYEWEDIESLLRDVRGRLEKKGLRIAYLDEILCANWNRPDRDRFRRATDADMMPETIA